MPPTDIYLLRHAESEWNAVGRWQGQANPPLSPRGLEQAAYLGRHFPDAPVTHVFASDLLRARETAAPLAARFGLELLIDEDLREIDVGSWSGLTRDQILERDPEALERYTRGEVGWEGGETFDAHEARCARAVRRLESVETDGVVVAVTHGGTIRALLRTLLELTHEERWKLSGPGHTSITHVTRGAAGWRLVTFNGVAQLERT
jgi:broad specificity phosphatase PhoE